MKTWANQGAAANRRPAGQLDGSGNLAATVAADRAFPAAVAELGSFIWLLFVKRAQGLRSEILFVFFRRLHCGFFELSGRNTFPAVVQC